jgi:hypothetical protein
MSDIAMDTPEPSQYGGGRLKLKLPDIFTGERSKLETWILQFDRHFHIDQNIANDDKVVLASTFMKGDAEKWVLPMIQRYMDENVTDEENKNLIHDWDLFKIKLRQVFSPLKESIIAEKKIQNLKQTNSAADYTTRFQQYAEIIQRDDTALRRMYKQGLKPQVRAELMRSGASHDTLSELIEDAIRVDNNLYELAIEERSFNGSHRDRTDNRQPRNQGRRAQPNQGRQRFQRQPRIPGVYSTYGHEAMHLDNLNNGKPMTKTFHKEKTRTYPAKDQRKETRDCYNCGKPGHLARDCRSKNKVTRQLNVLTGAQEEEEAEEWQVIGHKITKTEDGFKQEIGESIIPTIEEDSVLTDPVSALRNATTKSIEDIEEALEDLEERNQASLQRQKEIYAQMKQSPSQKHHERFHNEIHEETLKRNNLHRHADWIEDELRELAIKEPYGLDSEYQAKLQKALERGLKEGHIIRTHDSTKEYRIIKNRLELPYLNQRTQRDIEFTSVEDRPSTPHPGKRVPTVWDYQEEASDAEDELLSAGQLDIHTDSPTLGRKKTPVGCQIWDEYCKEQTSVTGREPWLTNDWDVYPSFAEYKKYLKTLPSYAHYRELVTPRRNKQRSIYRNDGQALLVTDETPRQNDWVDEAEAEYQQQQRIISSARKSTRYLQDNRNPKHYTISWTTCTNDTCAIHYQEKENAQWFPTSARQCKYKWFHCPKHTCTAHLWNKRTSGTFHPHTQQSEAAKRILINGSCILPSWHQCLQENCQKHQEDKVENGYLDLGAEETYSEQSEEDELESFLEQRLAPGITPGDVTLPIREHSSNSQ